MLDIAKKETQKKFHEGYQNLPEEERNKKREYGCERYKSLSED